MLKTVQIAKIRKDDGRFLKNYSREVRCIERARKSVPTFTNPRSIRISGYNVRAAFLTHKGSIRSENQDALLVGCEVVTGDMKIYGVLNIDKFPVCLVVIDGMGGSRGGAAAAAILAGEFEKATCGNKFGLKANPVDDEAKLREIMHTSSDSMSRKANTNPELAEMGATFAGVLIRESSVLAFNCGDCRVYRISQGTLERLTRDHSVLRSQFFSRTIPLAFCL